ncbi:MAG: signal peptidase I [bacterium]|nr:signal peptidase I [bacterium]
MRAKLKELIPYVIIVVVVILLRTFIITPVEVVGESMENTLKDNELLFLNKISYKVGELKRFDIVVLTNHNEELIKRIIALPGEHIEYRDNILYINHEEVTDDYSDDITNDFSIEDLGYDVIPLGKYFVLGDNRDNSADSRVIGLIDKKDISGTVSFRFWPLNKIGIVK